jgi:hypothetical protein
MEVHPKRKTDEEHVEFVRKQVARSKWLVLLHGAAFLFFLVMFMIAWRFVTGLPQIMPEFAEGAGPGFVIGLQLGAGAGLFVIFAVITVIFAIPLIQGQRTERLMLKFHDALKKERETSNQPSQPIAGKPDSG